jgi:hypothetical protein
VRATAQQPQRAPDGAPVHYERHRPEQTTLYRLVQQHAASFIAHTEASTGAELPRFIKDEFDAFLECGILAHGFLRLRCGECGHDKLLAFSCKRRGFCPSCGARRMSQTAAHLVDRVIPQVPLRQWVLSLPIPLRLLLAAQPELVTPVLQVVQRVVTRHLLGAAGLKAEEGYGGSCAATSRGRRFPTSGCSSTAPARAATGASASMSQRREPKRCWLQDTRPRMARSPTRTCTICCAACCT